MRFPLLFIQETHLFGEPQKALLERLANGVREPSRENSKKTSSIDFNGLINSASFIISRNVAYPQYFIPMIRGEFVEGEGETLLKLEYDLHRGTKVYLGLWTVICIIASIYCLWIMNNVLFSGLALGIMFLNYLIVLGNFRMHSSKSRETLLKILMF